MKLISFTSTVVAIILMVATISSAQPDWSVNPAGFEFTMTATSVGLFDCVETIDENDIVGAFINSEVRGVQEFNTDIDGRKYAFLIIYDNDFNGNEITFKLYDASEDTIINAVDTLLFLENSSNGNIDNPFEFRTNFELTEIALTKDSISKLAIAGTIISDLYTINENGDTLETVFDFVNDSGGSDNSFFSISGSSLILEEDVDTELKDTFQIHLIGIAENGCFIEGVFQLAVFEPEIVSTNELSGHESMHVLIYPNPASDEVFLESKENIDRLLFYDSNGRLIHRYGNLPRHSSLDVSFLDDQFYIILIQKGKETWSKKLIITTNN